MSRFSSRFSNSWSGLDDFGLQGERAIAARYRFHGAVDNEWGRSECLDPDNVGDIADEGSGHRG